MRKTVLAMGAVGALVLALVGQAEASPVLQFQFVQGGTTLTSAIFATNVQSFPGVVIGDYIVSTTGAWTETAGGSTLQTTTINVRRAGTSSANPLELYITAVGYNLPLASAYGFSTTNTVTKSGTSQSVAVPVDFQGYVDFTNAFFGVQNTNGLISCTPIGGGALQTCMASGPEVDFAPGVVPYSMTTRTVFNIAQGDTLSVLSTTGQAVIGGAVTAVPEPATAVLIGVGLLGLRFRQRLANRTSRR